MNKPYDQADIFFQATGPALPEDTPDILATHIHALKHSYAPVVLEAVIQENNPSI